MCDPAELKATDRWYTDALIRGETGRYMTSHWLTNTPTHWRTHLDFYLGSNPDPKSNSLSLSLSLSDYIYSGPTYGFETYEPDVVPTLVEREMRLRDTGNAFSNFGVEVVQAQY